MADNSLPLNRRIGNRNGVIHGHTIGKNIPTEYNSWKGMRHRCSSPAHPRYALYGGRGIKVCARWQDSFEAFLEDMGRKPGPGYSLDRIDVNGNYEPGNVRWADQQTQCRNQRRNRRYVFGGELRTVAEICEIATVEGSHLNYHIKQGRTADEAVAVIIANRSKLAGHCKNGHEMDDANTYIDPRGRPQCRTCRKAAKMRAAAKEKAA